ncbi:MAG TPA: hypothetical protein VJ717_10210 [Gemmatimonadaceae bacterium]|nr:hypothetical protein [Gemmatimonadaceae bacterium]
MRNIIVGIVAAVLTASSLGAQDTTAQREALKRRVQERLGAVVKQRLGLTDSQVVRLGETNRRFEEQRRLLLQQERDLRMSLRDELLAEQQGGANQQRIADMLDRTIRLQRQRVELLENEQRELARFLNATQRAKLLGMQEQLRRNVGEMRRRAPGTMPYAGPQRDRRDPRMRERLRDSGRQQIRRPPARVRPPIE